MKKKQIKKLKSDLKKSNLIIGQLLAIHAQEVDQLQTDCMRHEIRANALTVSNNERLVDDINHLKDGIKTILQMRHEINHLEVKNNYIEGINSHLIAALAGIEKTKNI